jgi:hypothetical protein
MKSFFKFSVSTNNSSIVPNYNSAKKTLLLLGMVLMVSYFASAQTSQSALIAATWTGRLNAEWSNAGNWNNGKVPDETTNITIPGNAINMPVIGDMSYNASAADINVEQGANITIPSNRTLNVFGRFISTDESRYLILGRINFAGKDQPIPGFTYNSIMISGGGIKTLGGNAFVNGMFILTQGVVKTDDQHTLTLGSKAMISAGNASSYISGPLTRITNSTYNFSFPVGDKGVVKNVVLAPYDETMSAYTVRYHNASAPANGMFSCTNLLANKTDEYYEVKRTNGSAAAGIQFEYVYTAQWSNGKLPAEGDNVAVIANEANGWHYTADASLGLNNIPSIPALVSDNVMGNVLVDDARYGFGFGYSSIDPLDVLLLNATLDEDNGIVNWQIRQGNDNVATVLEHSQDAVDFKQLYTTICANAALFNFTQVKLAAGIHYYRLKMTDKAGNISYSKTVELLVPDYKTLIVGLKATLIRNDGYVQVQSAKNQNVALALYDMSGRTVSKQSSSVSAGANSIRFNTMMVTPGIYNLFVKTADGATKTLRFMKE